MLRTVLVPLDGSALGEQALPIAVHVARAAGAELKLVHVVPPGHPARHPVPPSHQGYLDQVTAKVHQMAGLPATSALLHGPVAETLAAHVAAMPADLVVLSTHGRGAFSRFWLGSTADQFVRHATVPVLLVRPGDGPPPDAIAHPHDLRRVLIALDGSAGAEAALGPAVALGQLFGAEYTLLSVVEPVPLTAGDGMTFMPNAYDDVILAELVKQAEGHLAEVAGRMRESGLTVWTRVVVGEAAAQAILDAAKAADLTAVATHGRGGVARFFLGSVVDKVIRASEGPVLVARMPSTEPEASATVGGGRR